MNYDIIAKEWYLLWMRNSIFVYYIWQFAKLIELLKIFCARIFLKSC